MKFFKQLFLPAILLAITNISIYFVFSYLIAVGSTNYIGYYLLAMVILGLAVPIVFGLYIIKEKYLQISLLWILSIFIWSLTLQPIPYFDFNIFFKKIMFRLSIIGIAGLLVCVGLLFGNYLKKKLFN